MQHDSNVQTTEAEISKFPRNLIQDMWNSNVFFETILHIPTLLATSSTRVSDSFQEFLSDAYEDLQNEDLKKQCPTLESTLVEIKENDHIEDYAGEVANDIVNQCGEFEFLIKLETRIPYNFKFDENGKYRSNSLGGYFRLQWILAKNMVDAAEKAIKIAEAIHDDEEQKARKEQGLEG
ncbi:hypothetical protein [Acinetobacter sp. AG3]|uniref:hypothetical protein n=1 Tax=unclassified Acinetobacter TaxID=196816 RepID=UPI001EF079F6|nr:hypothetical protein [Acinetobacter sp. AG3]MCG7219516.1 hypothetical protein [Acinetobacter sp. AG3]